MEEIDKIIEKIESENLAYYSADEVLNILLDIKTFNLYRVIQSQKLHIEMCHNIINIKENWENIHIKWMSSGTNLDYHTWLNKNYNAPKIYNKQLCKDNQ